MNITIKINTDNAAFEDAEAAETARILAYLHDDIIAREYLTPGDGMPLTDVDGNAVGSFKVTK